LDISVGLLSGLKDLQHHLRATFVENVKERNSDIKATNKWKLHQLQQLRNK
jgi:hypothetical protein